MATSSRLGPAALALIGFLMAPAQAAPADPAVVKELAPTGTLRVAINLGNVVMATKDANGKLGGVSVVMAQELGKRLGVPVVMTSYDAAGKVVDALTTKPWDVAFMAAEPERAKLVAFSAPYVFIDGTYLVKASTAFNHAADLDRPGIKIAVARGAAYDLFLSRNLKNAQLVRADTSPAAIAMYRAGGLDAVAGVRQALVQSKQPGEKVLDDSFNRIEQAVAVPLGRDRGARYVADFVEEMKATGAVRRALDESGQKDATVAPAKAQLKP